MQTKLGPIPTSTSKTTTETIKIDTPTTVATMILTGTVDIVVVIATAIAPTRTTINPETVQNHLDPDHVTAQIDVTIAKTEMMT